MFSLLLKSTHLSFISGNLRVELSSVMYCDARLESSYMVSFLSFGR